MYSAGGAFYMRNNERGSLYLRVGYFCLGGDFRGGGETILQMWSNLDHIGEVGCLAFYV